MKALIILISMAFVLNTTQSYSQVKASDLKPFKLIVVNKKGKPITNGGNIIAFSSQDNTPTFLDKTGQKVFNVAPNDTIYLGFSKYKARIPVAGLDSAKVTIDGNKLYNYGESSDGINTGYAVIREKENTTATVGLDVAKLAASGAYTSLADLLGGRFAGVNVKQTGNSYQVTIRGISTMMGSTDPLVIVDGSQYTDFNEINSQLNIREVKSIDIMKDGSMYGSQGANGVIIVTTRQGGQ